MSSGWLSRNTRSVASLTCTMSPYWAPSRARSPADRGGLRRGCRRARCLSVQAGGWPTPYDSSRDDRDRPEPGQRADAASSGSAKDRDAVPSGRPRRRHSRNSRSARRRRPRRPSRKAPTRSSRVVATAHQRGRIGPGREDGAAWRAATRHVESLRKRSRHSCGSPEGHRGNCDSAGCGSRRRTVNNRLFVNNCVLGVYPASSKPVRDARAGHRVDRWCPRHAEVLRRTTTLVRLEADPGKSSRDTVRVRRQQRYHARGRRARVPVRGSMAAG